MYHCNPYNGKLDVSPLVPRKKGLRWYPQQPQRFVMRTHACNHGSFLPARTAAKMAFASSFVVRTSLCPVDTVHASMLVAFTPTKSLCK